MSNQDPLFGQLNFIVQYWWDYCETPFNLMIECAQEPAGKVALAFVTLGMDDIVRSFARPGGPRSARHGRKRKDRRKPFFNGVPEISDLMAERVDEVHEMRIRDVQAGVRSMWKIDGLIQGIIWNLMVVELAEDFTFQTILGMVQLKETKCNTPGRGFARGEEKDPFNNGQWYVLPYQETIYEQYPVGIGALQTVINGNNYYQVLSQNLAINYGDRGSYNEWEYRIAAAEGGGVFRSKRHELSAGSVVNDMFAGIVKAPAIIQVYQRAEGPVFFPDHNINIFPSFF